MTPIDPPSGGARHSHDHATDDMHNAGVEHEHSDINVRTVLLSAATLMSVVATVAVVIYFVFGFLERQAASNDPRVSPLAIPAGQQPPEPRLQTNEPAGLKQHRAAEVKVLTGYGWVDKPAGVAYMPIEEAKKALLRRGLPARAVDADPTEGTNAPAMGEASGGRNVGIRK